ncbi:MAG: hypothetical protein ABMB14_28645, partial [Myxococcota bacterium]
VGNGVAMLAAPGRWFAALPGDNGPFAPHFVQDVGAAYLAAGTGLLLRGWRPAWWPAAAVGSAFLAVHAGLHLVDPHHWSDALSVVLPAALAVVATIPDGPPRHALVRRILKAFSDRYDYDVASMYYLLDTSPSALLKFALVNLPASHRSAAPRDAWFAAKLVGAMTEDCGPCTQLVVNMAREAGVPAAQIEAVLARDPARMSADTALGYRFAAAVAVRDPDEDPARDAVKAAWGDAGVVDLSLGLAVGRVYPMTKAGLGFARECRLIQVDGRMVPVRHREAATAA